MTLETSRNHVALVVRYIYIYYTIYIIDEGGFVKLCEVMQDSVGGYVLATFALCAGAIFALLRTKAYAANKDMVQSCFLYAQQQQQQQQTRHKTTINDLIFWRN